jgi:succinylglutamate desuccinylase
LYGVYRNWGAKVRTFFHFAKTILLLRRINKIPKPVGQSMIKNWHISPRIGSHTGAARGPLVIITGAIHGNEPAGVLALRKVFETLQALPADIPFRGKLVGFIAHLPAFLQNRRFFHEDLNRLWERERLGQIHAQSPNLRTEDEQTMLNLYRHIQAEVDAYRPEQLVILDLHTTSADDGLFCIPTDEQASLSLARSLYVPVVLNLFDNVRGTLLRFSVEGGFRSHAAMPDEVLGVAFEAGQHKDPLAIDRSIAAIFNCLRQVNCLPADTPDSGGYSARLRTDSAGLPKVVRLHSVHSILPADAFLMRPGYRNFQPIFTGEHLADDRNGPVLAQTDGHILMPLYQPLGKEGFFVVKEKKDN